MSPERETVRQYMDVLELPEDASMLEIKTAYLHLKELYTKGSIAISPIEDEYPEDAREDILRRIEEAYAWLAVNYGKPREGAGQQAAAARPTSMARQEISAIRNFDGPTLRRVRELLGIEQGEVEFSTKIGLQHIKNIEEENFSALPEDVFVRGYIVSYAKCLGLEPALVADQFMKRLREGR